MNLGTAHVIRGDARRIPLPDDSVDLIVSSPPYFALRSYTDGGEHYEGQIGSEPTPQEFIDALIEVTREAVRVLKPTGSLWINLGDKYASYEGNRGAGRSSLQGSTDRGRPAVRVSAGLAGGGLVRAKSLMGIPWRYAIRCIDDLGLILRAEVIWSKPNGLPESVTDRVRRSHEQWFHLTREPRYYSAVDEIREQHARVWGGSPNGGGTYAAMKAPGEKDANLPAALPNPLGKLPGSVWTVPTEPLTVPDHLEVDHFAAFPSEWPKRLIKGWSPSGVCVACGEGRRPVAERTSDGRDRSGQSWRHIPGYEHINRSDWQEQVARTITGYACACLEPTAPTRPAVVLDPFGGTGTTAMVAKALGRHGISVDMSSDYCRIAQWRTNDRDQLAKVLGVEKDPRTAGVVDTHDSLLDLLDEETA